MNTSEIAIPKQASSNSFNDEQTQEQILSETGAIENVFSNNPDKILTAHAVAKLSGINYYVIQKRLSILRRRNIIKVVGLEKSGRYERTLYKFA